MKKPDQGVCDLCGVLLTQDTGSIGWSSSPLRGKHFAYGGGGALAVFLRDVQVSHQANPGAAASAYQQDPGFQFRTKFFKRKPRLSNIEQDYIGANRGKIE